MSIAWIANPPAVPTPSGYRVVNPMGEWEDKHRSGNLKEREKWIRRKQRMMAKPGAYERYKKRQASYQRVRKAVPQ